VRIRVSHLRECRRRSGSARSATVSLGRRAIVTRFKTRVEQWPAIPGRAVPRLPAAAAGQEEADEKIVLSCGIDISKPEHDRLEQKDGPVGHLPNPIDCRHGSSTKIDPVFADFVAPIS
jgi:hypothetical protein